MRRWAWAAAGVLVGLVALNGVAYRHAVAMTTFRADGVRTPPPEELGALGKVQTLLFGVNVPRPRSDETPASRGLAFESVEVQGPGGVLEAWRISGSPPTVVLVHGYAGHRGQLLDTAERLAGLGYSVVLPNLRGSGGSHGDRTTLGWHEAADVAAVARSAGDRPVLYGFSMGGAAVIGAVARHGVDARAVVVESTFDHLITTTGHRFAHMGLPRRGLSDLLLFWGGWSIDVDPYRVAPVLDAPAVGVPALVVAGTEDARVRPQEARAVAEALPQGTFRLIPGLPHAQVARLAPTRWMPEIGQWLRREAPQGTAKKPVDPWTRKRTSRPSGSAPPDR